MEKFRIICFIAGTYKLSVNFEDEKSLIEIKKIDNKFFLCLKCQTDEEFKECLNVIQNISNLKSIAFLNTKNNIPSYFDILENWKNKLNFKVYIISPNSLKNKIEFSYSTGLVNFVKFLLEKGKLQSWENFFDKILKKNLLEKVELAISKTLQNKRKIFPPILNIFKIFELVKLNEIRVIIIGQDCYHGSNQATGIAFSVNSGITPPPSLRNIFKELEADGFTIKNKENGCLEKWCEQGVFLINASLTVEQASPRSHSWAWLSFTKKLFKFLNKNLSKGVVIMWGKDAQSYSDIFTNFSKIKSVHPSPLSASSGFFGSKPFSKANSFLKEKDMKVVNWNL